MKNVLLTVGVLQLTFALFLAWVMVCFSHLKLPFVLRTVKNFRELLRAHLDYLLMSIFLMLFGAIERTLPGAFPCWLIFLACYGSTVNPLGFLIPSIHPPADQLPIFSVYKILLTSGFIATTVGFVGLGAQILCALG